MANYSTKKKMLSVTLREMSCVHPDRIVTAAIEDRSGAPRLIVRKPDGSIAANVLLTMYGGELRLQAGADMLTVPLD